MYKGRQDTYSPLESAGVAFYTKEKDESYILLRRVYKVYCLSEPDVIHLMKYHLLSSVIAISRGDYFLVEFSPGIINKVSLS